jgi:transcriptional regulator with XRE-family HTH domain
MNWYEDPESLRKVRKRLGLSQEKLSEKCALNRSAIADIETGRRELKGSTAVAIWDVLGEEELSRRKVPLSTLLEFVGKRPPQTKRHSQAHYFNFAEQTKDGTIRLEYQGPGMVTCEDHFFRNQAELDAFLRECITFPETVWTTDLREPDEDDD